VPEDFGYGSLQVGGRPVAGNIPLLVVTYEMSTNGSTRKPLRADIKTVFDQLLFNVFALPSVNGYFLENSHGRFFWQRADVIGPVSLDANETATLLAQQSGDSPGDSGMGAGAGIAYLLRLAAARTGYNFAQWDANGDGSVTQEELTILTVGNNGERNGANRPIGANRVGELIPGPRPVTLRGEAASLDHRASLMTVAHELSHSLYTADLYGDGRTNSGLTLMGRTIYAADDDRRSIHLDPWHKLRFGWVRPRILELKRGGIATVAAAQILNPENPVVLLYDPARGFREYFLIEFRSNQLAGGHHDTHPSDSVEAAPSPAAVNGLAIWRVSPDRLPAVHLGAPGLAFGGATLWTNQETPELRWSDGTPTGARLKPLRITSDGREMVFEWTSQTDTWVDFHHFGFEAGTFENPFNTVAEGVAAASHGGTLKLKAGSRAEPLTISKRLTLEAVGGPVTVR
jgi:M6 family metalloprotease-like protein